MNRLFGLLRAGRTRTKVIGLSVVLVLAAGAVAIAAPSGILTPGSGGPQGIVTVGPVNPNNGFPDWYRDTNGVDLAPCIDPQDKFCGGAVAAPDNTAPITFPGNFPDEFFYMSADADSLTSAGGNKVLAAFDLEGAFATGGPAAGDQIVFSRIRYKITGGLQAGANYKITQPYGTDTVTADDTGAFFVTQDVGVSPGDFAQALKGRVGPFLTWAQNPANPADTPPAGYIGDGVTPHAVTGSELGTNFVRIQGPNIGGAAGSTNPNPCNTTGANAYTGPVLDCIQTNNFVLVGKKSTTAGVDVTSATYEKTSTGTKIEVLANSKAAQDIVVQDGDNGPGPGRLIRTTPLRADGTGHYMSYVDVPGAMPKSVDVINRADVPVTTKHVVLTDKVTATADYTTTKGNGGGDKLHITASSSDSSLAGSALTLPDYGNKALDATGQADISTPAPPATVTVKSSEGGSVTVPVEHRRRDPRPAGADRQRRSRPDGRPGREGDPRRRRLGRRHRLGQLERPRGRHARRRHHDQGDVHRPDQRDVAHVHADRQERHRDEDRRRHRQGQPGQPGPGPDRPGGRDGPAEPAPHARRLDLDRRRQVRVVAGGGRRDDRLPGRGHDQLQADVPVPEDHDAGPHPAARPHRR